MLRSLGLAQASGLDMLPIDLKHALKVSLIDATYLLRFFCRSPLASRGGTGTRERIKTAWGGLHSYDGRRRVH